MISGRLRPLIPADSQSRNRPEPLRPSGTALADRLLQRHQRRPMTVIAGETTPASLTPAAIAYFTGPIFRRSELFNRRREPTPLRIKAAPGTELLLANNVRLAEPDEAGWGGTDEARRPTFQQMLAMVNRPASLAAASPARKAALEAQPPPARPAPGRPSVSRPGRGKRVVRRPPASYVQEFSPGEPPPKPVESPARQPADPPRQSHPVQPPSDDPAVPAPEPAAPSPPEDRSARSGTGREAAGAPGPAKPAAPPPPAERPAWSGSGRETAGAPGPAGEEASTFRRLLDKISRAADPPDSSPAPQAPSEGQPPVRSTPAASPGPAEFRPVKSLETASPPVSLPRPNPETTRMAQAESTPAAASSPLDRENRETGPPAESGAEAGELPASLPRPNSPEEAAARPDRAALPDRATAEPPPQAKSKQAPDWASPAGPENRWPADWKAPEVTPKPASDRQADRFEEAASLDPPLFSGPAFEPAEPPGPALPRKQGAESPPPDGGIPSPGQAESAARPSLSKFDPAEPFSRPVGPPLEPVPAKKPDRPRVSREPAPPGQSSKQALRLDLAEEITARSVLRAKLPVTGPARLRGGAAPPRPAVTIGQATSRLIAQGWRFKGKSGGSPAASPAATQTAARLERNAEPGQPLAPKPRSIMENIMGRDFGGVRIHTLPLTTLNVQAAAKERNVYVEPGQERFETPAAMALLGHELTHVAQQGFAKPVVQTAVLPQAQSPGRLANEEAEAERNEQVTLAYLQPARFERNRAGEAAPASPSSPASMKPDSVSRGETLPPAGSPSPRPASSDFPFLARKAAGSDEVIQRDPLDTAVVEAADETAETPEPDEIEPKEADLKQLARKIYPLIKRRLAIERQQMPR